MIAIIDYDAGNIKSVEKALTRLGEQVTVTRNPEEILGAGGVILPGVGAFGDAMERLKSYGLVETIAQVAERRIPFLGICLGLQLMFESSEESPGVKGLGLVPGRILRIPDDGGLKVPHMGWNYVDIKMPDNPLAADLGDMPRFYFVHSYHAVCEDAENVLMTSEYAYIFTASVVKENIYGTQFHPEKSHVYGLRLMENFVKRC